jgi:hypothetical protein
MRLLVQAADDADVDVDVDVDVVVVVVAGEPLLEQALMTRAASSPVARRKGTVALRCMCFAPTLGCLRLQRNPRSGAGVSGGGRGRECRAGSEGTEQVK